VLGPQLQWVERDYVLVDGKKLLYLAGIDYHRMSSHPLVTQAAAEAAERYGLSPTGSRMTTGNHILYAELERAVADFAGSEQAVVNPSGYLSNTILLQAIAKDFDAFFIDNQAHSSLADAARQLDQALFPFEHMDAQNLADLLRENLSGNARPLVLTDGVFPAMGDMAPLKNYAELLEPYGGKILVDDAHAIGMIGPSGKGSAEAQGLHHDEYYQTGTLSKAFGVAGGVIPADRDIIERIHACSMAFVGCTGLALPLAAAAIKAVSHLAANKHLITDLQERALALKSRFRDIGFSMPETPVPILSITYHDAEKNDRLRGLLLQNNIYPPFINYPGAPTGGHFRFILTSSTTQEQEDLLFEAVKSSL